MPQPENTFPFLKADAQPDGLFGESGPAPGGIPTGDGPSGNGNGSAVAQALRQAGMPADKIAPLDNMLVHKSDVQQMRETDKAKVQELAEFVHRQDGRIDQLTQQLASQPGAPQSGLDGLLDESFAGADDAGGKDFLKKFAGAIVDEVTGDFNKKMAPLASATNVTMVRANVDRYLEDNFIERYGEEVRQMFPWLSQATVQQVASGVDTLPETIIQQNPQARAFAEKLLEKQVLKKHSARSQRNQNQMSGFQPSDRGGEDLSAGPFEAPAGEKRVETYTERLDRLTRKGMQAVREGRGELIE